MMNSVLGKKDTEKPQTNTHQFYHPSSFSSTPSPPTLPNINVGFVSAG